MMVADIAIHKDYGIKVDNNPLTGSSEWVKRYPDERNEVIYLSENVVFAGTTCE